MADNEMLSMLLVAELAATTIALLLVLVCRWAAAPRQENPRAGDERPDDPAPVRLGPS